MNNVFKFKDFDIGVRYDLKGSSQSRELLRANQDISEHVAKKVKTALKDNDFRRFTEKITFNESGSGSRPKFNEIIVADADFLAANNIMDYSLLIGQILVLSDYTRIQNVPWSKLKGFAMDKNVE